MPRRTVNYLLQSDPSSGAPTRLCPDTTYTFDMRKVGAIAMKELIQTCRSSTPMTEIILSLLNGRNGTPLVWRENGPGVGWEMRNAWSGLFGRFFARTYLEEQGYSWFHSIQQSYNEVTDNIVVTRNGKGEIADWICAREESAVKSGNLVIAEAKGRHREGNNNINKLPRPLKGALDQINNTFLRYRDHTGKLVPKSAKGYAILTKWTNESKSRTKALIRVVDPDTAGFKFEDNEVNIAARDIGRAHISQILHGLQFEGISYESYPVDLKRDMSEIIAVLEEDRDIVLSRAGKISESLERKWMLESDLDRRKLSEKTAIAEAKRIEKEIKELRKTKRYNPYHRSDKQLREEAKKETPTFRVKSAGVDGEYYIGNLIGVSGIVNYPVIDALRHIGRLPHEIAKHFIFVGVRVDTVNSAVHMKSVKEWELSKSMQDLTLSQGVYASSDGVVVAPASQVEVTRRRYSVA